MPVSPLKDLRVDDWDQMIDVNIKGVLYGGGTACIPQAGIRAFHQYRVYRSP
jgi:NADP-dependent 3-hydroxy acid dehydrogenase YdfG